MVVINVGAEKLGHGCDGVDGDLFTIRVGA